MQAWRRRGVERDQSAKLTRVSTIPVRVVPDALQREVMQRRSGIQATTVPLAPGIPCLRRIISCCAAHGMTQGLLPTLWRRSPPETAQ
jgi:hypothetical protein